MDEPGKQEISDHLEAIRSEIREYFGGINEVKMGARGLAKAPQKPDCLVEYETMTKLHIPMLAGGYLDQPGLWMMEFKAVAEEIENWQILEQLANNAAAPRTGT